MVYLSIGRGDLRKLNINIAERRDQRREHEETLQRVRASDTDDRCLNK